MGRSGKMTLAEARFILKPYEIVISKTKYGSEYKVNWRGGKEETAGYETTIEDAVDTGIASYNHWIKYGKYNRKGSNVRLNKDK